MEAWCVCALFIAPCVSARSVAVTADGLTQAIAAAVKFAPWLLPSPFQQKQVASLMTSPAQTLTPLTQQELQLQQKRRQQLYAGLSEGLRVAVQVMHLMCFRILFWDTGFIMNFDKLLMVAL